MRHYILLFIFCLLPFVAGLANVSAASNSGVYKVTASPSLRVRQAPSTGGTVIGQKMTGENIMVSSVENGWAEINFNGQVGYVSAQYLEYLSPLPEQNSSTQLDWKSLFEMKGDRDLGIMLLIGILILSVITFIIRKTQEENLLSNDSPGYYVYLTILFILYGVEIAYQLVMGQDAIWFCKPNTVGWLWTVINFILFGIVLYNQIMCLMYAMGSILMNGESDVSFRWGYVFGIAGCGIVSILFGFFYHAGIPYALGAMGVCQLVQLGIIVKEVGSEGGFMSTVACLLMYILGTAATLILLVQFFFLLIIVLIGWLLLSALGDDSKSRRRDNEGVKTFTLSDGTEIIQDSPNSEVGYHDRSGRHYTRHSDGRFSQNY